MRRPQASFEAQPRSARLLAPRWASTPTARNRKCGDSLLDLYDFLRAFVGADDSVRPLNCFDFASDFRKNGQFRRADRVVRPYGVESQFYKFVQHLRNRTISRAGNIAVQANIWCTEIAGTNGLSYPVCRGGRPCPPSKFVELFAPTAQNINFTNMPGVCGNTKTIRMRRRGRFVPRRR